MAACAATGGARRHRWRGRPTLCFGCPALLACRGCRITLNAAVTPPLEALAEAIRRDEAALGVPPSARRPILTLTANAFPDEQARAQAVGIDACLTKPLLPDTQHAALAQWLPVTATGGPASPAGGAA